MGQESTCFAPVFPCEFVLSLFVCVFFKLCVVPLLLFYRIFVFLRMCLLTYVSIITFLSIPMFHMFVPIASQGCQKSFYVFKSLRWKVVVHFVNIGGTVDYHCLNFVISSYYRWRKLEYSKKTTDLVVTTLSQNIVSSGAICGNRSHNFNGDKHRHSNTRTSHFLYDSTNSKRHQARN